MNPTSNPVFFSSRRRHTRFRNVTGVQTWLFRSVICTNDVHYLGREDAYAHDVLLCIGTGATIHDQNRLRYTADEFYMKSPDEMATIFREFPGAVEQTLEIAERCNLEMEFGRAPLPAPNIP